MTEDRNNDHDDLDFDDDFVIEEVNDAQRPEDDEFLDTVSRVPTPAGPDVARKSLAEPPGPAFARSSDHEEPPPDHPGVGESDGDLLDDDEFVIEFGDDLDGEFDAEIVAAASDPRGASRIAGRQTVDATDDALAPAAFAASPTASAPTGLEFLFNGPAAAPIDEVAQDEDDALFTVSGTDPNAHRFEGVRERPQFVEDRAGWYGDDEDLAALVGEVHHAEPGDEQSLEFEEGLDDDPFAIDDVEIEGAEVDPVPGVTVFRDVAAETDGDGTLVTDVEFDADDPLADPDRAFDFEPGIDAEQELDVEFAREDLDAPTDEFEAVSEEGADPIDWSQQSYTLRDELPAANDHGVGAPYLGADVDEYVGEYTGNRSDPAGEALSTDDDQDSESWVLSTRDEIAPEEDTEDFVDPIYGDVGSGMDVSTQDADEDGREYGLVDPGYDEPEDEFEEAFVDATPGLRVVGGGNVRSFRWRRTAAAAVVFVALGLGVVGLRPEWVGLVDSTQPAQRVEIARPRVDLNLDAPGEPVVAVSEPPTGTEPIVSVKDPEVVPTPVPDDAEPTPPPVVSTPPDLVALQTPPDVVEVPVVDPSPGTGPVDGQTVVEPPDFGTPTETTPDAPAPAPRVVAFEPIPFGDGLEVRAVIDPDDYRRGGVLQVQPGTRAFAQLQNEETFVGVVKRVEAAFVTLDLQPGEISLARAELTALSPLESTDISEFTAIDHGYVRLSSDARLWGRILKNSSSDNIILRTDAGRVTIPASSLAGFGASTKSGSQLLDGEDDRWLDERARRKLLEFSDPNPAQVVPNATSASPPRGR